MNGGRLPDGTSTRDTDEYIEAWQEFAQPICEAADLVLYGFDPGIVLHTKEPYYESVSLPEWFVRRINDALAGGDEE